MFSRSPKDAVRTAVFIGGKDAGLALDMMERFRATLLKPFEISAFADPAGLHDGRRHGRLRRKAAEEEKGQSLAKTKILIFGATGVVGYAAAVIAALEGADVTLAGHDGPERVQEKAEDIKQRFNVDVTAIDTSSEEKKVAALAGVEVILCAAAAGVQVLPEMPGRRRNPSLVAADVNAVPPAGIEGLALHDKGDGTEGGALGIGPLAIGDIKYKTKSGLFQRMAASRQGPEPRFSRRLHAGAGVV